MHHWDQRGPVDPILRDDYTEKELSCTGCMGPCGRCEEPARQPIPGINVPWENESWQDLNKWRSAYGMPPVEKDWNLKGK